MPSDYQLDTNEICSCLQEGGKIAKCLSPYEPRESQIDLTELICEAFNEDTIAAAEAGTGVGKSFAYLLPAIYFSANTKEKIVISTATINLQQQLFEKDIPFVVKALNIKIKSVLMKGRANYLCLRRLDETVKEPGLDFEENDELLKIAKWAEKSKTGSRSELTFLPSENVWQKICSEADLCPFQHCPFHEHCFIRRLRKEAADANLIVVNHHLLFADLAARHRGAGYESAVILPPFSRLIIDEAHAIENAATSFYSSDFSKPAILKMLGRLYYKKKRKKQGLLIQIGSQIPGNISLDDGVDALENIRLAIRDLDSKANEFCITENVFRLSPETKDSYIDDFLLPFFKDLQKTIHKFTVLGKNLIEQIPEKIRENSPVWEMRAILGRLEDTAGVCLAFQKFREKQNDVFWFEKRQSHADSIHDSYVIFNQTPIEIAEKLKESLFEPSKTAACVSATLTVNNSFNYWEKRCGLNLLDKPFLSGCFSSPFPYHSSVLLASPLDAPFPDDPDYQEFINTAVARLAASSGGSSLILFTSYQSLQTAYQAAVPQLQELGINCLKQGDDDRSRLLKKFLDDESSVLFATDSFWEGVDAPGETLRLVIICRLPFRMPNNPVFLARCEAVQKQGGNAFMELSLPEAVMKFKQGFGRLMRRSSDHGAVIVLDKRLIQKNYGAVFLDSLPQTKTLFAELKTIIREMENFLFK